MAEWSGRIFRRAISRVRDSFPGSSTRLHYQGPHRCSSSVWRDRFDSFAILHWLPLQNITGSSYPSVFDRRHFIFSVFHTLLFPPTRIPFKLNDAHESPLTWYSPIIHFSDYIFPDVHSTSRPHNVISIAIYFVYNARFPN